MIFVWSENLAFGGDISGRYLMDGYSHRVIVINYIADDIYRIEEPTSPWPWSGCGFLYNRTIFGIVRFRENGSSMMLNGKLRSDGSIFIDYVFMTDTYGSLLQKIGPGRGRIDKHIWYKER
jgi:hypothetical protein